MAETPKKIDLTVNVKPSIDGQEFMVERAIRNNETGQLMTEWATIDAEIIRSAIGKSHNPERYAVMIRWVTPWVEEDAQ